MPETNPQSETTSHSMISLKVSHIHSLIERMEKADYLEIKRTLKAKLTRFNVPDVEYIPIAVLPGSSNTFSVQVDSEMNFFFTAHPTGDADVIHHVESSKDRKVSEAVNRESGESILEAIWLVEKYIRGLNKRLISSNVDSSSHVLVPYDLYSTILAIEGVFENEGRNALNELTSGVGKLRTWLDSRLADLNNQLVNLSGYLDDDGKGSTKAGKQVSNESDRIFIPEEGWYNHHQGLEYFIDQSEPNEYNRDYVIDSVKNLLDDFLLAPNGEWISEKPVQRINKEIKKLVLRISSTVDYDDVLSKLDPIEKALDAERGTNPKLDYESAKGECESIREICVREFSVKKIIENSPSSLNHQLLDFISRNQLNEVMIQEIKNNFNAHYMHITKNETEDLAESTLNGTFIKLNKIKYSFEKALENYEDVRTLLQEHSTTKDTSSIRKEAENEISEAIKDIRKTMMSESSISTLKDKSEEELSKSVDYKEQLESSLSANATDESVFWIGLGQAGGQILRECILYCLNNLSDARCRALMNALGGKKEDLQKIQHKIKHLYSSDLLRRRDAEKEIQQIFHNKIHLLAVNLGEEVDALADDDQPGYFLWGRTQTRHDSSTRTVRTTRNILKLKPKGEGAGGETGVGRAYGFRFRQDLTDVMKDVGKKGRSNPKHIVITHSLAGGSGSGMVLPVLQQARRTFGQDTVIWVVSVGEGASEARSVAKVNTPFIISDILQATYDGIHAIHKPIEFSDWRTFRREIAQTSEKMNEFADEFVKAVSSDYGKSGILSQLSTIFEGGFRDKYIDSVSEWKEALDRLRNTKVAGKINPINIKNLNLDDSLENNKNAELIRTLSALLPEDKEQSGEFSNWCEKQERGGVRPARDFWMNWIDCIYDPLSLFIEGRVKQHQTIADDDDDSTREYFSPTLTKNHLKSVMNQVKFELALTEESTPDKFTEISEGVIPLKKAIINKILDIPEPEKKESKLSEINEILEKYGTSLNKFNSVLEKMTVHIQSLSGTGGDRLIKSIIVSNAHLEKGITSTNNLESSGKAYTVYNSVIFDLMLNIIGPRLPAESGVFAHMEETFDHMDMVKSTNPPLVVGLLNQRDSISLTDTAIARRDKIDSDDIATMFSSMFTQPFADPDASEPLRNPMFLEKRRMLGLPQFFLSLFGSRYKYMLQTDPYITISDPGFNVSNLEVYCKKLISVWDSRENIVFDIGPYNREMLMKQQGITGIHIANVVKWISLIDKESLGRFIGKGLVDSKHLSQLMEDEGKIWQMSRVGRKPEFDIGVLRIDQSIGRFMDKDSMHNSKHLENTLSNLGVHNAEILRSVGPAYLNSYLPMELLFAIDEGSLDIESLDYKSFGISKQSFQKHVEESDMDIATFSTTLISMIKEYHTLSPNGVVDDPEGFLDYLFEEYETELSCVLDHYDLDIRKSGSRIILNIHPRLNRYFSAVRDIPTRSTDKLLPARSAPASLSRYLNSDSIDKPLDPDYIPQNRKGIASPTFTLGGNILNQMRYMSLLPDERNLSLIPFVRILLLGTGDRNELERRLGYHLNNVGIDLEQVSSHIDRIFSHKYSKLEVFNEPGIYSSILSTLVHRMNDLNPLLSELIKNQPNGWSKFDITALNYLVNDVIIKEQITLGGPENIDQLFGSGVESIPNVRSWLQDVVNLVVMSASDLKEESDVEDEEEDDSEVVETVSGGNPVIVGIRQLFYDIVYNLNEALGQAEYLDKDYKNSRSVHFEMTGFSDRLIGKPKGLLILVHDRNPKLPMDSVQESIRESINYNFGESLGNPKAFSTAADFGPTSYLTVVLQNSPAADISDQFQLLLKDKPEGLAGNNPFWAFENSKLHPYILLYNLLWLSTKIDRWTDLGNKEYIRRFQIPTSVILHHFCNPAKLDNDRIRLEKEQQSFPGDIKMPEDDSRDFKTAIKGQLTGVRNILKLIGIMALRYEKAGNLVDKRLWEKHELSEIDYLEMVDLLGSDAHVMDKEHLFKDEQKETKPKVNNPFLKKKKVDVTIKESAIDTIETRADAWFKSYSAWKNYEDDSEEDFRTDQAALFTVGQEDFETEESLEQVEE